METIAARAMASCVVETSPSLTSGGVVSDSASGAITAPNVHVTIAPIATRRPSAPASTWKRPSVPIQRAVPSIVRWSRGSNGSCASRRIAASDVVVGAVVGSVGSGAVEDKAPVPAYPLRSERAKSS